VFEKAAHQSPIVLLDEQGGAKCAHAQCQRIFVRSITSFYFM